MFNRPLLNVSQSGTIIQPSDVIFYAPMTSNFNDQGYYAATYAPLDTGPNAVMPVIANGWGKFAPSTGLAAQNAPNRASTLVYKHAIFDSITNTDADFTIEFNVRIVGDGQSDSTGAKLKTFPFSFVGGAPTTIYRSTDGAVACNAGNTLEMGMTIGSHQPPGGFGFGVGTSGFAGVAVACSSNDTAPNSYVNRGIAKVPDGNSDSWGPYYIAIVRKAGVVSIFVNGKKVNSPFGADETGQGNPTPGSTWTWSTFKFNTSQLQTQTQAGGVANYKAVNGLFIGGSWNWSTFGYDDDLYLQHFRITKNVARYETDFTPEPIYTL